MTWVPINMEEDDLLCDVCGRSLQGPRLAPRLTITPSAPSVLADEAHVCASCLPHLLDALPMRATNNRRRP